MRGNHLLIDARGIPYQVSDEPLVRRLFANLVAHLKLTPASIVNVTHFPADQTHPHGISASQMLGESHMSYHSFSETGGFAFDLYSCGHFDHMLADHIVRTAFNNKGIFRTHVISRDFLPAPGSK